MARYDISEPMPLDDGSYKSAYHWALDQPQWRDYCSEKIKWEEEFYGFLFCKRCGLRDRKSWTVHHPGYHTYLLKPGFSKGAWPWEYDLKFTVLLCAPCHTKKLHNEGGWLELKNMAIEYGHEIDINQLVSTRLDRYDIRSVGSIPKRKELVIPSSMRHRDQ